MTCDTAPRGGSGAENAVLFGGGIRWLFEVDGNCSGANQTYSKKMQRVPWIDHQCQWSTMLKLSFQIAPKEV